MRTRNAHKEQLVRRKAIELLVNHGFEGFSMGKLAAACNISVATLYIYYKDKDDLITRIATEELDRLNDVMLKGFDPEASFEEGLRIQWKNRSEHFLANRMLVLFFEQLRSSTYQEKIYSQTMNDFRKAMGTFMKNAVARGEIDAMPFEIFWSVAYGPLYTLLRFAVEGKSVGGKKYVFQEKHIWQTFGLVIKSIKK